MRNSRNFRPRPNENAQGLSVTVYNNNVEGALKVLKKKIKQSNLFLDLREKEYYTKPSEKKRHKRNLAKLRNKYNIKKEKEQNNY